MFLRAGRTLFQLRLRADVRRALCAALLVALCCTIDVHAQGGGTDTLGTGGRHSIQGRLVFPSGKRADLRLKIRLESMGSGDLLVYSDSNGTFSFRSLRAGSYTVIIDGDEHFESLRESVFIEPGNIASGRGSSPALHIARPVTIQIYLRPKVPVGNARTGVLNAALAAVPKPAADLYRQALDSATKGNTDKAVAELQQSLVIFPNFGLALNELGVQYMKQAQLEKAVEALRSAVALLPDAFEPRLNYGIALLNQSKFSEAEVQLRETLRKNGAAFTPHMYLGIALINLKNYQEAEAELLKAISLGGARVGQAHYYLAGLSWRAKDYKRAALQLEKYLELEPKAANAEKIRATIKDLRNKS